MSSELANYRTRSALSQTGVLLYVIIALTAVPAGSLELYPFFKWSLFSAAQNPKADNVLVVGSLNGVPLDSPTLFYDLGDRFSAAKRRDSRLAKTVDRLAYAVAHNNKKMEGRIRNVIETYWLRDVDHIEYDIRQIRYDPIKYYNDGEIISSRTIAQYRK